MPEVTIDQLTSGVRRSVSNELTAIGRRRRDRRERIGRMQHEISSLQHDDAVDLARAASLHQQLHARLDVTSPNADGFRELHVDFDAHDPSGSLDQELGESLWGCACGVRNNHLRCHCRRCGRPRSTLASKAHHDALDANEDEQRRYVQDEDLPAYADEG